MNENRGILARLMAVENITVEHRHTHTASFDVLNRVLTLPTWKDMSAELYDMLRAHEVGHALETPADGWHGAVIANKHLRSFLNVIEDARIEKLIKHRYPGLRPSFVKGYKELYDQNFFGTEGKDLSKLLLIDRVNLHFKIGSYLNVPFSENELWLVKEVEDARTWSDVVNIAKKIFNFDEQELNRQLQERDFDLSNDDGSGGGDFEEIDSELPSEVEGKPTDNSDSETQENSKVGSKGKGNSFQGPTEKKVLDSWYEFQENVESMTDHVFRMREQELLDARSIPFCYLDVPKAHIDQIIIGHKQVSKEFNLITDLGYTYDEILTSMNFAEYKTKFLAKNKRYVDHLVREFELKRNARQLARAGISKTGALNLKQVHKYKLTDDLFQRMTVVPKGKNHGMIMVFDQSGSMGDYYTQTLEQIMILAMFCRKINVPFHVYGFTDNYDHWKKELRYSFNWSDIPKKFSTNPNELAFAENKSFALREYFTHTQTSTEFKAMLDRVMLLACAWNANRGRFVNFIPLSERLHGTPLNEAIIALMELVPSFRKAHKLDIVNTIILTDGQSNSMTRAYSKKILDNGQPQTMHVLSKNNGVTKLKIRDQRSKIEVESFLNYTIGDNALTVGLLKLFKQVTGSRCVGYFIGDNYRHFLKEWFGMHDFVRSEEFTMDYLLDRALIEIKKNGFLKVEQFEKTGYDAYYRISKKFMSTENEELEVEAGAKLNAIRRAFLSVNTDKRKHRVLLSNFIDSIA